MRITATFLDEITSDIPSNNWNVAQWARDFKIMKAVGIDTVIMIRAGLGKQATFTSKVLEREIKTYPVYEDLPGLFLTLAEENDMKFFFPTYDSYRYWLNGDLQREIEINKALVEEIWDKYGHRKAFAGWYLTNEFGRKHPTLVECVRNLGLHCKAVSGGKPTIISPFLAGSKIIDEPITVESHKQEWSEILDALKASVDIVAFQDGQVDYHDLPEYLNINHELITAHGMTDWSNVETFDRDMPFRFPPIDWRKLWWKMEAAVQAGVSKLITFEFSHFLSPYSCWPSARNLFNRYCEHFGLDAAEICAKAEEATTRREMVAPK